MSKSNIYYPFSVKINIKIFSNKCSILLELAHFGVTVAFSLQLSKDINRETRMYFELGCCDIKQLP